MIDNATITQANPHYKRAPITEAVIDVRVEPATGVSAGELKNIFAGMDYQTTDPIHVNVSQIQFGPSQSATTRSQHSGFLYKSYDTRQIIQAQVSGLTFSRLAPYQNWELFSTEARRLWKSYREIARPTNVIRVAVRYINRIDIPLPLRDFNEYLRTVPEIASDLPQGLSAYLMQLVIPLEDINGAAVITETMIPPPSNFVSILLDIDVSVSDIMPSDSDLIWETFDTLRYKKNLIFNACLTEKAKELFK